MNSGLTVSITFALYILFMGAVSANTLDVERSSVQGEKAHEKLAAASEELTKLQVQRLAGNARMYKEKVRPLQDELRINKRRLTEILTDEDVSVQNAQLLQSKIGTLKSAIRDLQLKKQLADSMILTANQRKVLRGQFSERSPEQHKILAQNSTRVQ